MSTARLANTYTTAMASTAPCTFTKSRKSTALSRNEPSPGTEKTCSITAAPPSRNAVFKPMTDSSVNELGRNSRPSSTRRDESPIDRAKVA